MLKMIIWTLTNIKYTNIMSLISARLHQNWLITVHVTKKYSKALPRKAPGSESYTDEFHHTQRKHYAIKDLMYNSNN